MVGYGMAPPRMWSRCATGSSEPQVWREEKLSLIHPAGRLRRSTRPTPVERIVEQPAHASYSSSMVPSGLWGIFSSRFPYSLIRRLNELAAPDSYGRP